MMTLFPKYLSDNDFWKIAMPKQKNGLAFAVCSSGCCGGHSDKKRNDLGVI